MSLMSISQSASTSYTQAAPQTNPLDGVIASVLQDDGVTSTSSSTDTTQVSSAGSVMKELSDLAQSDPTTFKKVTADVAKKLEAEASSTTDPGKAKMLKEVAASFEKASVSGDASDLKPPKPPGGAHGRPPAYASSSSSSTSDVLATLQAALLSSTTSSTSA